MDELVTGREELIARLATARRSSRRIALVPTMGALHDGHISLIHAARAAHEVVVCSIFVNPLQFEDRNDLERYPGELATDLALATSAGATICFAPDRDTMYPGGEPQLQIDPGPLGELLEGATRPGHLRGVATVVAKLFALVWPDSAYFGEKDYQQLLLVRRLCIDLGFPLTVMNVATRRDADGLALSSRNARLSAAERRAAPVLHRALLAGQACVLRGARLDEIETAMADLIKSEPLAELDYAVVRDASTLERPGDLAVELRLCIAARVGGTRLIDNMSGRP